MIIKIIQKLLFLHLVIFFIYSCSMNETIETKKNNKPMWIDETIEVSNSNKPTWLNGLIPGYIIVCGEGNTVSNAKENAMNLVRTEIVKLLQK